MVQAVFDFYQVWSYFDLKGTPYLAVDPVVVGNESGFSADFSGNRFLGLESV